MSNELTLAASIEYDDGLVTDSLSILSGDDVRSLTTDKFHKSIQSVGTSEEAVGLGDITTRCVCMLINLDSTNYIEVKTGTGGTIFAKLYPRGSGVGANFCLVPLGSGAQSPFVIANTASCEMAIFLCAL